VHDTGLRGLPRDAGAVKDGAHGRVIGENVGAQACDAVAPAAMAIAPISRVPNPRPWN
jgi:hypothetical protein